MQSGLLVLVLVLAALACMTCHAAPQNRTDMLQKFALKRNSGQPLILELGVIIDMALGNPELPEVERKAQLKEYTQRIIAEAQKLLDKLPVRVEIKLEFFKATDRMDNRFGFSDANFDQGLLTKLCDRFKNTYSHLDVLAWLTSRDIRGSTDSSGIALGDGGCEPEAHCMVAEGFAKFAVDKRDVKYIGMVVAHELAHLFGVRHDTATPGSCPFGYIMQGTHDVSNGALPNEWSECSKTAFENHIRKLDTKQTGNCLRKLGAVQ